MCNTKFVYQGKNAKVDIKDYRSTVKSSGYENRLIQHISRFYDQIDEMSENVLSSKHYDNYKYIFFTLSYFLS